MTREFTYRPHPDIEVRFRATEPAITRLLSGPLVWAPRLLDCRAGMIGQTRVATVKTHRPNGSLLTVEGFQFWGNRKVAGPGWSTVRAFAFSADACKFVERAILPTIQPEDRG